MGSHDTNAVSRFATETWTAGVIGLGYVGLPLAVTAAKAGLKVLGFDVNEERVAAINSGTSHVEDVTDDELREALDAGAEFTCDETRLGEADALFIAVPSPLSRARTPDMRFIKAAADTVSRVARPGMLVSLESTSYPGTTEDYLLPAVEEAGLTVDEDVFVAFSPERVDPGNVLQTADIPKVVGGVSQASTDVAAAAYNRMVSNVHPVSSARAAELTKLLENTYRAINIAAVNELARIAHELDIDVWEVIDAAATKPFGFQAFYPGPGVGGHCIPLDPQFLAWRVRELRIPTRFIDLAEQVNLDMPAYVSSRAVEMLNDDGVATRDATVLAVGLAYKRNIADDRESPSTEVLQRLADRGVTVYAHDPFVPDDRIESYDYIPAGLDKAAEVDLVIVLTDHDDVDYAGLVDSARRVFDTRGVLRKHGLRAENIETL